MAEQKEEAFQSIALFALKRDASNTSLYLVQIAPLYPLRLASAQHLSQRERLL